ncbi:hypothetical protein BJ912DRAFT_998234 [Pholiota molesta]|nr:hypothetical protein BJ912DRAFT_998234 [Pholiota molesta]
MFTILLPSSPPSSPSSMPRLSGNTIVQVITTPVGGPPVTSILTTIPAAIPATSTNPGAPTTTPPASTSTTPPATTLTSQASITPATVQMGPVGQPATTSVTPGAPIAYIYTTVINGAQTVIQDVFTPTSPSTISIAVTGTGSILAFSDFTKLYGPVPTSSATSLLRSPTWLVLAASAIPLLVGIFCL